MFNTNEKYSVCSADNNESQSRVITIDNNNNNIIYNATFT